MRLNQNQNQNENQNKANSFQYSKTVVIVFKNIQPNEIQRKTMKINRDATFLIEFRKMNIILKIEENQSKIFPYL